MTSFILFLYSGFRALLKNEFNVFTFQCQPYSLQIQLPIVVRTVLCIIILVKKLVRIGETYNGDVIIIMVKKTTRTIRLRLQDLCLHISLVRWTIQDNHADLKQRVLAWLYLFDGFIFCYMMDRLWEWSIACFVVWILVWLWLDLSFYLSSINLYSLMCMTTNPLFAKKVMFINW